MIKPRQYLIRTAAGAVVINAQTATGSLARARRLGHDPRFAPVDVTGRGLREGAIRGDEANHLLSDR